VRLRVDLGRLTVSTQSNGADLASVCDSKCLEDTPRDTTENLRNQQVHHRLSREEDGSEANDEKQAPHDSIAVPDSLTDPSVEKQTDNLAHNDSVGQSSLPWRGNLPRAVRKLLAVFPLELRESKEVVQQTDIVALHDDTRADKDRPSNRLGIELDTLQKRHIAFLVRGESRIADELVSSALVVGVMVDVMIQRRRAGRLNILLFRHDGYSSVDFLFSPNPNNRAEGDPPALFWDDSGVCNAAPLTLDQDKSKEIRGNCYRDIGW
jgi:hypothetical protein